MKRNNAGGVIVDRHTEIDWAAAEAVAAKCDSRTALLVRARHVGSLRVWLGSMLSVSDRLGPQAEKYRELAGIVGVDAPRFVAAIGDVDRHGDVVGGGAA